MPDPNRPTNKAEEFTPEMIASFNRMMKSAHVDRPIRKIASPHLAGVEGTGLTLLGGGPPALTEIGGSDLTAIRFATTNTMNWMWHVPADVDLSKDIDVRMVHSNKVAGAGTILWTWLYRQIAMGGSVAIAQPTSVFDSNAAPQNTNATADVPYEQGWSTINGGKLTLRPGRDLLLLKATCTLVTVVDADAWYPEVQYWSKFTNAFSI